MATIKQLKYWESLKGHTQRNTGRTTLLLKEHIRFHKIYGKRNNTKEQLLKFLTSVDAD